MAIARAGRAWNSDRIYGSRTGLSRACPENLLYSCTKLESSRLCKLVEIGDAKDGAPDQTISPASAIVSRAFQPQDPGPSRAPPKWRSVHLTQSLPYSICDLQEKFRSAIHEYARVIATTQKLLKASRILNIPVFATTQLKAKLGGTCAELGLDSPGGVQTRVHADKSAFSMLVPEVRQALEALGPEKREVVIVGIESHICVTQTTLDLLREGYKVYVVADGVSSCNKEEVPIALARLRAEGAIVTSSESFLYECMGDAGIPEFKAISALVKEYNGQTRDGMQALCKI